MSLGLVRKNSSSPFMLQRSMVDQGGEGGAYARTSEDKNKDNEKKSARLERRAVKTESKKQEAIKSGNVNKAERMKDRGERVETRLKSTNEEIKKYKESKKPTLTSDIVVDSKKEVKKQAATTIDVSSNDWRKSILGWDKSMIKKI